MPSFSSYRIKEYPDFCIEVEDLLNEVRRTLNKIEDKRTRFSRLPKEDVEYLKKLEKLLSEWNNDIGKSRRNNYRFFVSFL
jgi:peptidoglycan hydrolase CwlO-like protein